MHVVNVDGLHLRSAPVVAAHTKLAVLRRGDAVERIEEGVGSRAGWWRVRARVPGAASPQEGWVAARHLREREQSTPPLSPPLTSPGIRPVHLDEDQPDVTRDATGRAWRFPLGEAARPMRARRTLASDEARAAALGDIVRWLEVERRGRWQPRGTSTYCNVYAHDYAYLAGAYLPRVWWTGGALAALAGGATVAPVYGRTVRELTANALHDWFEDHGAAMGWTCTTSLTELQEQANAGRVCIVVARRRDLTRPGHIAAVVPETAQHRARRTGTTVTAPLQCQAGARNFSYDRPVWWTAERFESFGYWSA